MGSPMVFQTAPPQPASKARITCSPQLVGGAEASQKGLRHLMPAKVVSRVVSGILSSFSRTQEPGGHGGAGALAIGDGVDDLAAAVGAVAACEVFGIGGLACGAIDEDAAALELHLCGLCFISAEELGVRGLADGEHYMFDGEIKGRVWYRDE